MRRRRSDELPRFFNDDDSWRFRWRRRYAYYLLTFLALCWFLYPSHTASPAVSPLHINWSNFAYSFYATDTNSLCHAVLLAEALARLGSKADRVLFYPEYWDTVVHSSRDRDSQLLLLARDTYGVKLQPAAVLSVEGRTGHAFTGTFDRSVTKLLAFGLEYYDRVIALDGDITLLQSLDELFLLPSTRIAMPRAYWSDSKPWPLSSMLMVIKPSADELERFKFQLRWGAHELLVAAQKVDMQLLNERFEDSALVLPHRPYALLTSEFRKRSHATYLGGDDEAWDANAALKEAKLVHFNDYPLPKPWILWPNEGLQEMLPDCGGSREGSCAERLIWKHLYDDFRRRRHDVCKLLSVPAPEWAALKQGAQLQFGNVTLGGAKPPTAMTSDEAGKAAATGMS